MCEPTRTSVIVALADVPPCKGRVQVGDGLGVGDGVAVGVGMGEGEALGVGLAEVVGEGVAGGLPPVGPAVPQATAKTKSANDATARMPRESHQESPSGRAFRHRFEVTFVPTGSNAGSCALDLIAELVLEVRRVQRR